MNPREALATAVTAAFSDMAFLDCAEIPEGDAAATKAGPVVLTGFTRPLRGHIALHLSLECKSAVAENVFGGVWGTLTPSQVDDCLLELGNIIAGNFLTAYTGTDRAHDVSLPEIRFDETGLHGTGQEIRAAYDAEGRPLTVVLCLET